MRRDRQRWVRDPRDEAMVLLGYIVENAHALGRGPDGRTVLALALGDAVLDQLAAFGAWAEDAEEDDDAEDEEGATWRGGGLDPGRLCPKRGGCPRSRALA